MYLKKNDYSLHCGFLNVFMCKYTYEQLQNHETTVGFIYMSLARRPLRSDLSEFCFRLFLD